MKFKCIAFHVVCLAMSIFLTFARTFFRHMLLERNVAILKVGETNTLLLTKMVPKSDRELSRYDGESHLCGQSHTNN
jgi:hypothetical protein